MAQYGLHWSERKPDPNIRKSAFNVSHMHRPRIASDTIVKMLTLKSKLLGTPLDILKEAAAFERANA